MQKTMVGKIRRSGMAAALVALVGGTGAANAAIIRGSWDPEYGPSLPGLAFTGEAEFYVPDSLLNGLAINSPTFFADPCIGGATGPTCFGLRSASVDLYTFPGAAGSYPTGRVLQETLQYAVAGGPYGSTLPFDPLNGVVVQYDSSTGRNEVIGASTLLIGPVTPIDLQITAILGSLDAFWLRLGPGAPDPDDGTLLLPIEGNPFPVAPYQRSSLFVCDNVPSNIATTACLIGDNAQSNPATVVFSRVPEPGSLALVLGALAAGWAARRSRQPADPASC